MAEKISKLEKIKELVTNTFPNDGEWSIVKLELQKDRRDYEHKVVASFNKAKIRFNSLYRANSVSLNVL